MRFRCLHVALAATILAGCDRPPADSALLSDYDNRQAAEQQAALQNEMAAIEAIKANAAAQAMANEALLEAELAVAPENVDMPVLANVAEEDDDPVPPRRASVAPSPAEIDAAEAAVNAAMERRRSER